jgi:hypothetical protein
LKEAEARKAQDEQSKVRRKKEETWNNILQNYEYFRTQKEV